MAVGGGTEGDNGGVVTLAGTDSLPTDRMLSLRDRLDLFLGPLLPRPLPPAGGSGIWNRENRSYTHTPYTAV